MVGKAKEEGTFQETHCIAKRWELWEQEIIQSLVHMRLILGADGLTNTKLSVCESQTLI